MPRARVSIQILVGWLLVWALYSGLILIEHQPTTAFQAAFIGVHAIVPAALLGFLVLPLAKRFPWPEHLNFTFVAVHLCGAAIYALSWLLLASLVESVARHRYVLVAGGGFAPFLLLGVWLYAIVAGVSYAIEANQRASRAEALATSTQLATLRAQLHPHFLFNALHTVVQLIPAQPGQAAIAAEQLAGLLRTAVEENRDLVPLSDEWLFVSRYLDIERIRFGDRLRVVTQIEESIKPVLVPSFALQTLVENAVRHGAAPRVEATTIRIAVSTTVDTVSIGVSDDGAGSTAASSGVLGTGLSRLRERLLAIYGRSATLSIETANGRGFSATLTVPRTRGHDT